LYAPAIRAGQPFLCDVLPMSNGVALTLPNFSTVWAFGRPPAIFGRMDWTTASSLESHSITVKDMPLSRLKEGNVLVAYELNGEPLKQKNGFPARLVIPGFYGTNCVKWLCRLELSEIRSTNFNTTKLYSQPDFDADPTGGTTSPVWAVAPESIIVAPKPESRIATNGTAIWGWAWSSCAVRSVEISTDGGADWIEALLEDPNGLSWQRFSHIWLPLGAGSFDLRCRATDANGRVQPVDAARNAIHSIHVTVGA
jgi:hypothetical protein